MWPASLARFPLGQWTADGRHFYARGDMDEDRVAHLEKLGMVWSHYDVAWDEGLTAARGWAAEAGHLLAPTSAVFQGCRIGIRLKNARAAGRKAAENERWRAEGLPVRSSAGALSDELQEFIIAQLLVDAWVVVRNRPRRTARIVCRYLRLYHRLPARGL